MPRILIVKGPGELFLRLTDILSQAKHEVFEVESGEEALEFGPSIAPDLVLVSIVLPHWNGLEVAARLRSVPGFESIKILLLGYFPPIGINDEPLASLVNGYLDANISAEDLIARIETQLATSIWSKLIFGTGDRCGPVVIEAYPGFDQAAQGPYKIDNATIFRALREHSLVIFGLGYS